MDISTASGYLIETIAIEIKDAAGNIILIRTVTSDINGEFTLKFKVPSTAAAGEFEIIANVELDGQSFSGINVDDIVEPESVTEPEDESVCGEGTVMKDGKCVVDTSKQESEK